MGPHLFQAGKRILELCQLHRQASLISLRVGRKNIEDQFRPIDDFDATGLFKIPSLSRAQIVIENNEISVVAFYKHLEFLHLAFAQISRGIRLIASLNHPAHHVGTRSGRKAVQFVQRIRFEIVVGQ